MFGKTKILLKRTAVVALLIVMMLFNWAPKCIEWRQKMAQKFRKNTKKEAV